MEETRVPAAVKVLTVGTYFLAGLVILVLAVFHLTGVQAGLSSTAIGTIENLTFFGGIIAAVILVIDTAVLGSFHILKKFPSTLSIGTMVYNDVALIAAVFLMVIYDNRGADFPYAVAYAIPAITFVLAAICLIDDCRKAKAPADAEVEDMEYEDFAEEEELATETVFEPDYNGTTDNLVEDAASEEGPSEKELRKLEKQKAKEEKKQAKLLAKQQKQAEKEAAAEQKAAEKAAAAEQKAAEKAAAEKAKVQAAEQKAAEKAAAAEQKAAEKAAAEEAKLQAAEEAAKAKAAAPKAEPSFQNTNVQFKSISFDDFGDYMEDDD